MASKKILRVAVKATKSAKKTPQLNKKDNLADLIDRLEAVLDKMVGVYQAMPEDRD